MNYYPAKVALIAAAASVLTSAIHAFAEGVFGHHYGGGVIFGFIIGYVIGELPSALICFVLVYFILKITEISGKQ